MYLLTPLPCTSVTYTVRSTRRTLYEAVKPVFEMEQEDEKRR